MNKRYATLGRQEMQVTRYGSMSCQLICEKYPFLQTNRDLMLGISNGPADILPMGSPLSPLKVMAMQKINYIAVWLDINFLLNVWSFNRAFTKNLDWNVGEFIEMLMSDT